MGKHHLVKSQGDGRVPLGVLGDHVKHRQYKVWESVDGEIILQPLDDPEPDGEDWEAIVKTARHVYTPPEENWT